MGGGDSPEMPNKIQRLTGVLEYGLGIGAAWR